MEAKSYGKPHPIASAAPVQPPEPDAAVAGLIGLAAAQTGLPFTHRFGGGQGCVSGDGCRLWTGAGFWLGGAGAGGVGTGAGRLAIAASIGRGLGGAPTGGDGGWGASGSAAGRAFTASDTAPLPAAASSAKLASLRRRRVLKPTHIGPALLPLPRLLALLRRIVVKPADHWPAVLAHESPA